MKRSRIFLGLTTACLAIVGVVAAKKASKTATVFYVTSGPAAVCASVIVPLIYYSSTGAGYSYITASTTSNHATVSSFVTSNCQASFKYKKEN